MAEAESAQRGFLLSENKAYLAPYEQARLRTEPLLQQLLTFPGVERQSALKQADKLIHQKFEELEETIQLTKNGQKEKAMRIFESGEGLAYTTEIHAILGDGKRTKRSLKRNRSSLWKPCNRR